MIDYLVMGMRYGILAAGCLGTFLLGCLIIASVIAAINGIVDGLKQKED